MNVTVTSPTNTVQGTSVAETFLSLSEWKVRGMTRNPSSETARALEAKGVEIVQGDLNDKQSLLPAFEGATVIFANTDFFAPLQAAMASPETTGGRDSRRYAHDIEFEHGTNIAEAAASPATLKTLERFIWSSLCDPTKCSKGKYTQVYHNDVKAEVERMIQSRFPELAARMSTVHLGHYVTNWQVFPPARPQKQADGIFVIERTFTPELIVPFVFAHKDTGPFVKALAELKPGVNLLAYGEELTWPQFVKMWGDILGVNAVYKQVSDEQPFAGVLEAFTGEFIEAFGFVNELGFTGGDPGIVTADQVSMVLPRRTKLIFGS